MVRNKLKPKLHVVLPLCNHHRKHQGVPGMLSFDTSSLPPGFFRVEGGRKFRPACRGEPGDTVYPKDRDF